MKAVILAAGKGTRMLPLTMDTPKVLIEINGKPFLWYVIQNLRKAGFGMIGIVVGHNGEKIGEFCHAAGIDTGIDGVTLIHQQEQKGTGDALLRAREFIGDDTFLVNYGDNLMGVRDLKDLQREDGYHYCGAARVQNPQKYGLVIEKEGFLQEIREKTQESRSALISTGLYVFTPEIFTVLETVVPSSRGEIELTDAVNVLARRGKVKVAMIKDFWLDLGSKEDIKKVEAFLSKRGI